MSFLRRFWDGAYSDGEHLRHWELPGPSPELAALLARGTVAPPGIALDLGCGAGRDAIYLEQRGFSAIGADISAAALELARQRAHETGVPVTWCLTRVTELPLADDSVDFALDRGCFHTLEGPARARYATAVARVLRPGGLLFLRGSAEESEEDGLFPIDRRAIDRYLRPVDLVPEWIRPLVLTAPAGNLAGRQALLRLDR